MLGYPCSRSECAGDTVPGGGNCYSCRQHLCKAHWFDPSHKCRKDRYDEEIGPAAFKAETQRLQTIIDDLDIVGSAIRLRPGHSVKPTNQKVEDLPQGRFNIHVIVDFDDGVRWCARIRQKRLSGAISPLLERAFMQGEIDVLGCMSRNEVAPVPKVYSPIMTHGGADFYFMEFMSGTPCQDPIWSGDVPRSHVSTTIMDFAKINIRRSQHPLRLVGSIHHDKMTDTYFVGPYITQDIPTESPPKFPGPWRISAEKYGAQLDYMLEDIAAQRMYGDRWQEAWVVHRWLKEVFTAYPPFNVEEDTFLLHEDSNGGHILVERDESQGNGGKIIGLIDWERASVGCKAEAFAVPLCFQGDLFEQGSNEPSWAELELAQAYTLLGRPDLAACLILGKPYQWYSAMIGDARWEEWKFLRALGESLGIEMEENMRQFISARLKDYKAELSPLVARAREAKKAEAAKSVK